MTHPMIGARLTIATDEFGDLVVDVREARHDHLRARGGGKWWEVQYDTRRGGWRGAPAREQ